MPDGKVFNAVLMKAPNWISAVIWHKTKKKFVMNYEYRQGVAKQLWEFPSGTAEEGETPEETAKREVKEETGFDTVKITKLFTACPNPAFMNNKMNCFFIEVDGEPGERHLDADENISVHYVDDPEYLFNEDTSVMQILALMKARAHMKMEGIC